MSFRSSPILVLSLCCVVATQAHTVWDAIVPEDPFEEATAGSSTDSGAVATTGEGTDELLKIESMADNDRPEVQFERFMKVFGREYGHDPVEKEKRFKVFLDKLKVIDQRNAHEARYNKHPNRARHGITKFADWTLTELQGLRGFKPLDASPTVSPELLDDDSEPTTDAPITGTGSGSGSGFTSSEPTYEPTSGSGSDDATSEPSSAQTPVTHKAPCSKVHLTAKLDSGVRNQGGCNDCWAFETAELLRSAYIRKHGEDPGELSTQYLVDCVPEYVTCNTPEYTKCQKEKTCLGVCMAPGPCSEFNAMAAMYLLANKGGAWGTGGIPTAAAYGDFYTNKTADILGTENLLKDEVGLTSQAETKAGPPLHSSATGITYSGLHPNTKFACKSLTQKIPKKVEVKDIQFMSPQTTWDSFPVSKEYPREHTMAEYVCNTGSTGIGVSSIGWDSYVGGVLSRSSCLSQKEVAAAKVAVAVAKAAKAAAERSGDADANAIANKKLEGAVVYQAALLDGGWVPTDHNVIIVGLSESQNAWIVQNSFGDNWGVRVDGTPLTGPRRGAGDKIEDVSLRDCAIWKAQHGCDHTFSKAWASARRTMWASRIESKTVHLTGMQPSDYEHGISVRYLCPISCATTITEADGAHQDKMGGGYIHIAYGENACNIINSPLGVVVE